MTTANQPVYPQTPDSMQFINGEWPKQSVRGGLTKREHFAGLAMQGLLGNATFMKNTGGGASVNCPEKQSVAEAATMAVRCADALLAALERR